jgi:putative membrane protein
VETLLEKMDGISSEKVENLIEIIKNNPTGVTDFLASPLEVKEQDVYEGGTFGVGLTPFYTVLAIWVGSLLLCAMLSVECEAYVFGIKLNIIQKHYGKMILFLSLSLIQALIITVGDVYIVGVKPENFMLMIQFSLLASVTFTVMIFTLVSIFGNVGKAIAVVIMVFQIAGSGGIYPIQTNPEIFGKMLALWPFTYAMNGIREAIAGPVWSSVAYNAMALVCFIVTFLLLAILKKPFHRMNMFFEHKFKEADL